MDITTFYIDQFIETIDVKKAIIIVQNKKDSKLLVQMLEEKDYPCKDRYFVVTQNNFAMLMRTCVFDEANIIFVKNDCNTTEIPNLKGRFIICVP